MQAPVTPEQRQAAKREIVRQVEQGTSAKVARVRSAVPQILAHPHIRYCWQTF
jgi:hypothetical protein